MLIWIARMANFSLKLEAIMGSGGKLGLYVISNWFLWWKSLKWTVKRRNILKWCNLSHEICRCFPDVCISGGLVVLLVFSPDTRLLFFPVLISLSDWDSWAHDASLCGLKLRSICNSHTKQKLYVIVKKELSHLGSCCFLLSTSRCLLIVFCLTWVIRLKRRQVK